MQIILWLCLPMTQCIRDKNSPNHNKKHFSRKKNILESVCVCVSVYQTSFKNYFTLSWFHLSLRVTYYNFITPTVVSSTWIWNTLCRPKSPVPHLISESHTLQLLSPSWTVAWIFLLPSCSNSNLAVPGRPIRSHQASQMWLPPVQLKNH